MRHGADDPDRLGGWSNYGLSETGIRQVNLEKCKFADKGIKMIMSSTIIIEGRFFK